VLAPGEVGGEIFGEDLVPDPVEGDQVPSVPLALAAAEQVAPEGISVEVTAGVIRPCRCTAPS
jgi:hypothetical protein